MNPPDTPANIITARLEALGQWGIQIGPWNEIERWGSNAPEALAVLLDGPDGQIRFADYSAHVVAHRLLGDDPITDDSDVCFDACEIETLLHDIVAAIAAVLDLDGVNGVAGLGWNVIDVTATPADGFQRNVVASGWAATTAYRAALDEMLSESRPCRTGAPMHGEVAEILAEHARSTVTDFKFQPERVAERLPVTIGHANPVWTARFARAFNDLALTFDEGKCPAAPESLGDRIALYVVVEAAAAELTTTLTNTDQASLDTAADAIAHLLNLAADPYEEAANTSPGNWFLA